MSRSVVLDMNIVLDTNILVSALFSSDSKPFKILDMALSGEVGLCCSLAVFEEYEAVLFRPKFNFAAERVQLVLDAIRSIGEFVEPIPSAFDMPDETDRKFYDVASACGALLITGNLKHYPSEPFIISPADFLAGYEE